MLKAPKSKRTSSSMAELKNTTTHVEQFIDLMDERCILDLFTGGYIKDVDEIFRIIEEETDRVVNLKNSNVNKNELNYLPSLKAGYEDYLRTISLPYFINSCLPDFQMSVHNFEWCRMIEIYKYLCIMAARDHCFGKGTRVRMYDGSIKNVEDIVVGDQVMGMDSTHRNVLSLHSGISQLYEVKQSNGDSYVVSENHILALCKKDKTTFLDIPTNKYYKTKKDYQDYFGYKSDFSLSVLGVKKINIGEYYGFECDCDHRFVLSDGTVAHNSKSYTFSWAAILWDLYRYQKKTELITSPVDIQECRESMLITNSFDLAKSLLLKIKDEIETNPILSEKLYPGKMADGWSRESLTCKNRAKLYLGTVSSSKRGFHIGRLTLDDFLDRSAIYSSKSREKFRDIFYGEIINMSNPNGRIRVIGTPFHLNDLYSDLKKDEKFSVFEYPAIFPDGSVLWPERYDFDALLAKRKSLGNLIFSREILVRPVSSDVSIFPWNILETAYIGMQSLKMVQNRQSYPVKFKKVAIGCDFALSGTASADYSAFITIGMDSLDNFHIINVTRMHGSSHAEQVARIQRLSSDMNPDVIICESNGFQRVLLDLLRQSGIKNVVDFKTNSWNKKDLQAGLPSLAILFETAQIKIPIGDEASQSAAHMVLEEFGSITFSDDTGRLEASSGHDDCVMAIFFAIKALRDARTPGIKINYIDF